MINRYTTVTLILAAIIIPVLIAQTASAKSSLLSFAQGREDGKVAGKAAAVAGQSSNSRCPQADSLSAYCLGYIEGYGSGYSTGKSGKVEATIME